MDAAPSIPTSETPSHLLRWVWFGAWALVGGAGAFGLVSLIPIAMIPALIAGLAISRIKAASRSAFGLIAGAGFLSLGVAYYSGTDQARPAGTARPGSDATSISIPSHGWWSGLR